MEMEEVDLKYLGEIKRIRQMRNAMIMFSFYPIVFILVSSMTFLTTQGEYSASKIMALFIIVMAVYPLLLLANKRLELKGVAKCGLIATVVSFLLGAVAFMDYLSFSWAVFALVLYIVGVLAFVSGVDVNISVKLIHIIFYAMMIACMFLIAFHSTETLMTAIAV